MQVDLDICFYPLARVEVVTFVLHVKCSDTCVTENIRAVIQEAVHKCFFHTSIPGDS